ncbi:hypothetical protein IWX49DRAFT_82282 [Phyllosticta citricarpa]|uniref:Uncharacterized protein n=1 Tax=Phyllosticta citricarpa TaxID=55181 RepID=A0ABR1MPV4_9PEZI
MACFFGTARVFGRSRRFALLCFALLCFALTPPSCSTLPRVLWIRRFTFCLLHYSCVRFSVCLALRHSPGHTKPKQQTAPFSPWCGVSCHLRQLSALHLAPFPHRTTTTHDTTRRNAPHRKTTLLLVSSRLGSAWFGFSPVRRHRTTPPVLLPLLLLGVCQPAVEASPRLASPHRTNPSFSSTRLVSSSTPRHTPHTSNLPQPTGRTNGRVAKAPAPATATANARTQVQTQRATRGPTAAPVAAPTGVDQGP